MIIKILISVAVYSVISTEAYKILGLFPHHGKSHVDVFLPIMKGLALKGHEVTVVSHYPLIKHVPNYRDVSLKGVTPAFIESIPIRTPSRSDRYFGSPFALLNFANTTCETGLAAKSVHQLIKGNETFDVIIVEMFNSDCFLGFLHKFKASLIGVTSCTIMPWTSDRFGQPTNPSYIPDILLPFSDKMSFFERLENMLVYILHGYLYEIFFERNDQRIAKEHFGYKTPPLRSIAYNASLLLVNTHFSLNFPRPNVPGVIEIGGVHIGEPRSLSPQVECVHAPSFGGDVKPSAPCPHDVGHVKDPYPPYRKDGIRPNFQVGEIKLVGGWP